MRGKNRYYPWVRWSGPEILCDRCGAVITLPSGCSIDATIAFMNVVLADHAKCVERSGISPMADEDHP